MSKNVTAAPPPPVTTSPEKPAEQPTSNTSAPSAANTNKPVEVNPVTQETKVEAVKAEPFKQEPSPSAEDDEAARLQQEIEKELQDVSHSYSDLL